MSELNISAALSGAINAVLKPATISEFTVDVHITNLNDSSYNYIPQWIDKITITQSFAEYFMDHITLELTLAPADYMKLFNNSKGLQVALRFVYYDSQKAQRVFTPPPIARTYKALLMNPQDLSKKYTTGSLMPTESMPQTEQHVSARIPAELYLTEDSSYTIRQQQFHGIYQKQRIADVITHITSSFGIKQMYIVPPDNTMVWDHIVIPPAQGIEEIFDYLQHEYGVYMKGIDWFYTNSVLYVYPAFENNPVIKYKADIYNAPSGSYAGLHSYHSIDTTGTRLGIVSTTEVRTTDISMRGAENIGTGFSFMRASVLMDRAVTNNKKGSFINDNNSLIVGSKTDRTMGAAANVPKHTKTTDNIFEASSEIVKWEAVLLEMAWNSAVPFLLYPGHNIKYHFDRNSKFTTQQGILERVVYSFKRGRQISNGYVYGGSAVLNIRADSDITNLPQTTSL